MVPEGKYPWMARLAGCGAFFITDLHALTAKHCAPMKGDEIKFGSNDRKKLRSATVSDVITHPKLDIAILTLSERIKYSDEHPICLPSLSIKYNSGFGIAAGWGTTLIKNDPTPTLMRETTLEIANYDGYCKKNGRYICGYGSPEMKTEVGYGDSGGPFMAKETGGR